MTSRSENQFLGDLNNTLDGDCGNFEFHPVNGMKIVPCGAIANSLFNDTLRLTFLADSGDRIEVPLKKREITMPYEREVKFSNPPGLREGEIWSCCMTNWNLKIIILELKKYSRPVTWQRGLMELDPLDEDNNGFQNEDLIVWMKNEALPKFRKLYRKVDHASGNAFFEGGLPRGNYVAEIEYSELNLG
jgi:hypothetical protein